jgi:single-strand DNA-binding protein
MFQQCIIMGNLGRDPEMRYTANGKAVTVFTVAVNNRYQEEGEWKDKTTWFRVTCWDKLAETTNQYLKKGRKVFVVGRVDISTWSDKQSGEARGQLELTAREVKFLDGRQDGSEAAAPSSAVQDEGDIPF